MTSRSWTFTSYSESAPEFCDKIRYLGYQQERCPTTGKLHWQGYLELFNSMRLSGVKKLLGDNSIHLEKRRGTRDEARNYCIKDETRVSGPFEFGNWISGQGCRTDLIKLVSDIESGKTDYELLKSDPEIVYKYMKFIKHTRHIVNEHNNLTYLNDNFVNITYNSYQKEIIKHIEDQDDRKITWITDIEGNKGKTYLSKHLIASRGAIRFTNGKTSDIAYAYNSQPIVVFDFARTCEDRINYQVIEDLKNGMIFSGKYESACKIFKPPKIVIMANFEPKFTSLSLDRWDHIKL